MNYKSNPTTVKDLTKLDLDASQAALTKALSEMELEKHELEDQRSATLNILEDISESQKELQIKYKELKIIKNLIQNLGMTFKADLVMGYIIESIQELFPEVSVAYCNFLEEMPAPGPLLKIYPTLAIGSKYPITIINAVKKVLPSFKLSSAEQAPAAAFMRAEANYKLLSGKFSDGLEIVPNCQMTIPLKIDNIVRGLINFSSVSKDCTSQKNISFFTMILESADQTVEHLKNLVASEHSRLQDLINSMANGVLMFDLEGQVIAVNPTFRKFFGRLEAGSSLSYLIESLIRQNPEILEKFDI